MSKRETTSFQRHEPMRFSFPSAVPESRTALRATHSQRSHNNWVFAPRRRVTAGGRGSMTCHRFAARTLINWYRAGLDVERELPKLATYLCDSDSGEGRY